MRSEEVKLGACEHAQALHGTRTSHGSAQEGSALHVPLGTKGRALGMRATWFDHCLPCVTRQGSLLQATPCCRQLWLQLTYCAPVPAGSCLGQQSIGWTLSLGLHCARKQELQEQP